MGPRRNSILIWIGLIVLIIGTISPLPMGESWEEKEGKLLEKRNDVITTSKEERTSGEDNQIDKQSPSTDSGEKKCATRYDVCRTYGPKLLPCCEGYVCKVTYGEQHCVESWFKIT